MPKSSTPEPTPPHMDLANIFSTRGIPGIVEALQVIIPLIEEYLPQILALLEKQPPPPTTKGKSDG